MYIMCESQVEAFYWKSIGPRPFFKDGAQFFDAASPLKSNYSHFAKQQFKSAIYFPRSNTQSGSIVINSKSASTR
jgi:hypothetical protein